MHVMKKTSPKIYRSKLCFSKEEIQKAFTLEIAHSGISIPKSRAGEFDKATEMQFGWWGGSSDTNKFYPGLDVQSDVIPKPEDFIEETFRLISATIVGAGSWKATDFSQNPGLLKTAMPELLGKPIYRDHDTDMNNWLGFVKNVTWQPAFTQDGVQVPAGINGLLAIDAKTEPKMARGILMGVIFSNSVTVEFDWVMSHSFDSGYEFDMKVGTMHEDGTMIRRIVVAVYTFHETSMCWLGADPFAKLIDKDGKLRNIDKTSIQYNKDGDKEKQLTEQKKYEALYGMDAASYISLSKRDNKPINEQPKNQNAMNKFLAAFLATFGASIGLTKKEDFVDADLTDGMIEKITGLKLADPEHEKKAGLFTQFFDKALAFLKKTDEKATDVNVEQFFKDNTFISNTELARLEQVEKDLQL